MALVQRPPLDDLVASLAARAAAADSHYRGEAGRLVHVERLGARPSRSAELARPLPDSVADCLGVAELWSHQVEAIDLLRSGRSVAVATGTASGKSLIYQAVIAEAARTPVRAGTALLVFPTKALARDQHRSFAVKDFPGVAASTYDGDTGNEERAWARRNATVVLTNPEMLHSGILPHHPRWATFFSRLRYVVIDEMHVFRGVFGSHVAQLLRRLRRLCAQYGSEPTFCFTSATIGTPGRLASALSGVEVDEVIDDGSPVGERLIALWNPPLLDRDSGARVSSHSETAGLVAGLVGDGLRTIAFCRSRRATEVVAADAARRLPSRRDRIAPYRGGYLADERRDIEESLAGGEIDGIVTTNALELGVDVQGLDAVVLDGFPGTVASFWQQIGRAGRRREASLGVLVAGSDQLDQWLMRHPRELFRRAPEPAVVNPGNPSVLDPHLRCAAFERPIDHGDDRLWPDDLDDGVRRLVRTDTIEVHRRHHQPVAHWVGSGWPAHGIGLRTSGGGQVSIVDRHGDQVGTVEVARAPELVHAGAVYLHRGRTWSVTDLDLGQRYATVEPNDGTTFTVARTETTIELLDTERSVTLGGARLAMGSVEVTTTVTGFQRKLTMTHEVVERERLDLPPSTLTTKAFWYEIDDHVLVDAGLAADRVPGSLHGAEHATIGMLPLFAICDRWDVGGVSTPCLPETQRATIVIYDAYSGGAGVAELGYEAGSGLLLATLRAIDDCPCRGGCPSCVQSPKCGNGNEPLDKTGAAALLRRIIGVA